LFRTDLDKHPSKYIIINDASARTSTEKYGKDKVAYYDPTRPQPVKVQMGKNILGAISRYKKEVYPLDQKPYYGPTNYVHYTNVPEESVKVGIIMGNLTEVVPTRRNIKTLKTELDLVKAETVGKNFIAHETKGAGVYDLDKSPYYDPTKLDKARKIKHLSKTINKLTEQLNDVKPELGVVKVRRHIQNFINNNKENTNKFIRDSFYYPVDKKTLQNEQPENVRIRTGTNYYGNSQQVLVEADAIDTKRNLK